VSCFIAEKSTVKALALTFGTDAGGVDAALLPPELDDPHAAAASPNTKTPSPNVTRRLVRPPIVFSSHVSAVDRKPACAREGAYTAPIA